MSQRLIDLSHELDETTPVYPGDPCLQTRILEVVGDERIQNRRALNSSSVEIGLHCGTHLDSPFHFYKEGRTIETVPLNQCVGPTFLLNLSPLPPNAQIDKCDLDRYEFSLRSVRKVILFTGWSQHWGKENYFEEHPVLTGEAAKFLVNCGVHLVGVDFPSVDRPPFEAHLEFLGHNMVILENLTRLEQIPSEVFQLIAIPLKLRGREASPVRAIAMEVD